MTLKTAVMIIFLYILNKCSLGERRLLSKALKDKKLVLKGSVHNFFKKNEST